MLAACTDNAPSGSASAGASANPRALSVQATDTACTLSAATAPSGNLTFSVTNGGSKVTEFYLLAEDGLRIVGEIENIGPGISRDLVLRAGPGSYFTACKPGMIGEGIRAPVRRVRLGRGPGAEWQRRGAVDQAGQSYQSYVKDQTEQLRHQDRGVRRALQGRPGRGGPCPVRAGAGALGADRAGRRVVR